jgi:hypothetical protein
MNTNEVTAGSGNTPFMAHISPIGRYIPTFMRGYSMLCAIQAKLLKNIRIKIY